MKYREPKTLELYKIVFWLLVLIFYGLVIAKIIENQM